MNKAEIILIAIAIAVWLIWYELRYGIQKRKENQRMARHLSRKWKHESDLKWKEYAEERKSKDQEEHK